VFYFPERLDGEDEVPVLPVVPELPLVPVVLLASLLLPVLLPLLVSESGWGLVLSSLSLSLPLPRRRDDLSWLLLSLLEESLLEESLPERFAFISAEERPVGDNDPLALVLPLPLALEFRLKVELALFTTWPS
jgi:hypothetical protein